MQEYVIAIQRVAKNFKHHRISWLITGFITIFSVVFLSWMAWHYLPTLLTYKWNINILPLIFGFPIYTLDLLLAVFGWSSIIGQFGHELNFRDHIRVFCSTRVAGRIPGAPWHIVGRVALYKQLGVSVSITSVASGLEIILIIISGIITSVLVGFNLPKNLQHYPIWAGFILIIGLGLIHPAVVRKILQWLGHANIEVQPSYLDMLLLLGLYILVWGVGGCVLYTVIFSVYPLPIAQLPVVIGAWGLSGAIASLLSLSPISFGVKEITLSLLLAIFIPTGLAIIIAIIIRFYITAAEFLWAIVASRLF